MKKEYTRPVMMGEEFTADEYVSACFACLDLNGVSAVYEDDGDKVYEPGEEDIRMNVNFKNDCYQSGTESVAHRLTPTKYAWIVFQNGQGSTSEPILAPIISGSFSDSPHFGNPKSNMS